MARLKSTLGVIVEVDDEKADALLGMGYEPADGSAKKSTARKSSTTSKSE